MSGLIRANDFKNCIYCKIIEIYNDDCKLIDMNGEIINAHIYSDYRNKLWLNNDDIVLVYCDNESEYFVIYAYTTKDAKKLKNEIPFDVTYDSSDDSLDNDESIKNLYSLKDLQNIILDIDEKNVGCESENKMKANIRNDKFIDKYKHKARGGKHITRDKNRARERDKKNNFKN